MSGGVLIGNAPTQVRVSAHRASGRIPGWPDASARPAGPGKGSAGRDGLEAT